jgi:hypothetical protein
MQLTNLNLSLAALFATGLAAAADCNKADYLDISGKFSTVHIYTPYRGSSTNCGLGKGNESDAVKALQRQLNLCGYAGGPERGGPKCKGFDKALKEDGKFGKDTENALKQCQKQWHADVDGIYGPETRGKMYWGATLGTAVSCATLTQWRDLVNQPF